MTKTADRRGTAVAAIVSTHIHPMRFMRNRPFARKSVQLYRRMVGRHMPTMESLNAMADLMMPVYNDAIMALPFEKRPERPTAMITQEVSLAMHVGAFVEHGRNIFFLESHIVGLLDRTDLTGVRCGDVVLPFDCFHISFGDAFDGSLPGPPNKIDGAYITTHPQHDGSFQVVVTSRRLDVHNPDKPNRWPLSRDLYFYAPLDLSDADATVEDAVRKAVESGEIKIEQTALAPDDDTVIETPVGSALVRDVRHLTDADETAWNREALPTFRRALALVINSLCYLNATEEDSASRELPDDAPPDLTAQWNSPKPKLRDRAKAGLLERGFIPVVVRKAAGPGGGEISGPEEGHHPEAHWRRGHWRRQPYGQGRAQIKLKWIRPTLVAAGGAEIPDTRGHLYRLT